MSMSQEEIEVLMNGLDLEDESSKNESNDSKSNMSEDDINDLISQTENINTDKEKKDEVMEDSKKNDSSNETNIDDILKELEDTDSEKKDENIDELISNFEEDNTTSENKDSNLEELLSSNSEISSNINKQEDILSNTDSIKDDKKFNDIGKDWSDNKINEGIFPLPAGNDTKVVNQLSEVANDSEEQARKVMDILSNILEYNNDIQNDLKILNSFNEKQISMLSSLNQKFPNIEVFKESLLESKKMTSHLTSSTQKVDGGTNDIFQAMKLMQFNDINRQKIERVMSVIRKLATYLNNIFEDDESHDEVVVAKHIHGDKTSDLVDDEDLESLIAEFNK